MEQPNPPRSNPTIAGAIALLVLGLVVFVPSGLCTGTMIVNVIASAPHDSFTFILLPLFFGGPFVAGGGAMLWFGIKEMREILRRRSRE